MNALKQQIQKKAHELGYAIHMGSYSKNMYAAGYCQSPKTGKWGAYINGNGFRETVICDDEMAALAALHYILHG